MLNCLVGEDQTLRSLIIKSKDIFEPTSVEKLLKLRLDIVSNQGSYSHVIQLITSDPSRCFELKVLARLIEDKISTEINEFRSETILYLELLQDINYRCNDLLKKLPHDLSKISAAIQAPTRISLRSDVSSAVALQKPAEEATSIAKELQCWRNLYRSIAQLSILP